MARQKTLNKNLVAFVTVMGMLLVVAVVALATRQQTRRDPEIFAKAARQFEDNSDFERAIERYLRAYDASKRRDSVEVKYLVDAARCAYRIGMIRETMQYLAAAHTQRPDDATVLEAQLERLWELSNYPMGEGIWPTIREGASELLKLKPDHVFALVALGEALRVMQAADPTYERQSLEALDKAQKIDPTDPRLTMVLARRSLSRIMELKAQQAQGRAPADAAQQIESERQKALAALESGVKAHPDDMRLGIQYAQTLLDSQRPDEAGALIEQLAKAKPNDAEVLVALGRFRLRGLVERRATMTAEEQRAQIAAVRGPLAAAVTAEPALYETYVDLARLALMDADPDANADKQADLAKRYLAALAVYEDGMAKTIGLKSLRGELNKNARPQIYYEAFRTARGFFGEIADARQKQVALSKMKKFVDDTTAQYPDLAMTYLLQGELAMANNSARSAQLAYLKAEEKSRDVNRMVFRLASEQLAYLYRDGGELGSAMRYAEAAIQANQRDRVESSPRLMLTYAQLLLASDKAQEALDVVTILKDKYPGEEGVVSVRVAALQKLGRADEARRILEQTGGASEDVKAEVIRAKLAFTEGNCDEAMQAAKKVLQKDPTARDIVNLFVACASKQDDHTDARAFLKSLRDVLTDDGMKRMYEAYDVVLGEKDEKVRADKLQQIIDQIPDEAIRLRESYNLRVAVNDLPGAKANLDKLEKLMGDDPGVIEERFSLALRMKDFAVASDASAKLGKLNVDDCNGARYRAQLAIATEKWDEAIRDLRTALSVFPNDSKLRYNLAFSLLRSGSATDEAVGMLKSAIDSNPQLVSAYKMIFEVLEQTGRHDEAMSYLTRAQKIAPKDAWIIERTDLLEEEKDPRKGIARREQLREKSPTDIDNLTRLADLYVRANEPAKADETIRAAAKVNAGHAEVGRLILTFYSAQKQREAGEALLRQHIEATKGGDQYVAMIRQSRFHESLGDGAAAKQVLDAIEKALPQMLTDAAEQKRYRADIQLQFAEFFARQRQFAESIDSARRVLDGLKRPDDDAVISQARARIIDNLFELQKWGDLEKEIDLFGKDFPDDLRGKRTQARYLFTRRRLEEARNVLTEILDKSAEDPLALYMRGTISLEQRRFGEARDDLQKARRVTQPEKGRPLDELGEAVRIMLANYFDSSGNFELAETALKEVLEASPGNQRAAARLMNLYRVNKRLDSAQKTINDYITLDSKTPFWPFQLGLVLMDREDYSAAAIQFRNASELSQYTNSEIVTNYLRALIKGKRADEAIRVFESMPPDKITPVVRVAAASAYAASQKPEQSAQQLDQAAAQAANTSLSASKMVAVAINLSISAEEALRVMERVAAALPVESEPGQRIRVLQAQLYIDLARAPDGLKLIEEVIRAAKDKSIEKVGGLLTKAEAQYRSTDLAGAIETYKGILAIDSENIDALNNLAYFLTESGKAADAVQYVDRLLLLARGNANIMDTVGWVYFKAGRLEEAERVLRDAARADIDLAAPVYHLGEVLEAAGRKNDARDSYRDALQTAQKQKDAEYMKKAQEKLDKLK
ncbi:MAG: tetratricopeptide repeat protein [Phycisphaerales bacterium]|nr:tetratricopeptide repeat protein [Phycisphaerales bacterium]